MHSLFEQKNALSEPIECFLFNASTQNFPIKPHWHYFAEFIYMLSGTAEMTADDRVYTVRQGDFILFPPSAVHSMSSAGPEMPVYAVLKFDLVKFPSMSSYSPSPVSIFRCAAENGARIHFDAETAKEMECSEICTDCIEEIRNYRYGYDVMLRAQIYRLIYRLIRYWTDHGLNLADCTDRTDETNDIEHVTEYIDSHLEENIKVRDLAAACHLSYSAFAVRFRERYGLSCKEYIERMRIYKAEEYLLFTDHDINYISQETGFSDCSHFIKCFRQYRGTTPKQFRMKRRGKS